VGVLGGKQNELLFTKEVSRQFLRPTLSPLLAAARTMSPREVFRLDCEVRHAQAEKNIQPIRE